jgi:GT2 family glycosyltransferase
MQPLSLPGAGRRLCALITCFNRRDTTLACLAALERAAAVAGVPPRALVVDDGSRDGTAAALRSRFGWARVVEGGGDLYWARGMHLAQEHAMLEAPGLLLWLNDDTHLDEDALARLLRTHDQLVQGRAQPLVLVGSTRHPTTGQRTYGGCRRAGGLRTVAVRDVEPGQVAQRIDTFDGNIVLVNAAAARQLGNLDAGFEHAMADTDYGLRAGRLGIPVWLAPGTHGVCSTNPVHGTHQDPALPAPVRWRLMLGRKGLPPRSWWRFTRRHGGVLWPLHFAWPYLRLGLELVQAGASRKLRGLGRQVREG